jgi:hypothetical protein
MNVSKDLQAKLDRLEKIQSCNDLTFQNKLEIERLLGEKLNRSCGSCTRTAMFKLIKKLKEQKPRTPVIHFIGVKQ